MSMKSTMMIPPMLRSRSCLTTSSTASRLVRRMVSSWLVLADEAAGVDVDRGERLGLVENQVAARLQPDLAVERAVDLRLDLEMVEDRLVVLVQLTRARATAACSAARTGRCVRRCRDRRTTVGRLRWRTRSRTVRSATSRSLYSIEAGGLISRSSPLSTPRAASGSATSRWISRLLTPSHAVRTMKPPCCGRTPLTAARSRARSSALPIRRETPTWSLVGM